MFYDPRITKVYLYSEAVDCRKSHNGLTLMVTHTLQKELRAGSIFLFVSKSRKVAKALKWDGSGLGIYHKKLERGRIMGFDDLAKVCEISSEEFMSILSGSKIRLDLTI
jgi:transposase